MANQCTFIINPNATTPPEKQVVVDNVEIVGGNGNCLVQDKGDTVDVLAYGNVSQTTAEKSWVISLAVDGVAKGSASIKIPETPLGGFLIKIGTFTIVTGKETACASLV